MLPNDCKREPNSVYSVTYSDLLCHSTILLFPSLSSFPLPFFHHSLPFFQTVLSHFTPFTPSSPSVGFTPPLFPLPPCPANLFQKKGYHGERITSAHTSPRAKREITQRRKNGSGVQTGRKKERKCLFKLKADSFVVVGTCLILEASTPLDVWKDGR